MATSRSFGRSGADMAPRMKPLRVPPMLARGGSQNEPVPPGYVLRDPFANGSRDVAPPRGMFGRAGRTALRTPMPPSAAALPDTASKAPRDDGSAAGHPALDILGKLWTGPNTVLGLAAAGTSYLAGKLAGTNPSFQTGNKAIQLLNSPLNYGNRAYTLGNVQVYGVGDGPERRTTSYTGATVNKGEHEEGHSVQAQILGPFYLPAWGLGRLFGGDSPGNPMEKGADAYALGKSRSGF